MIDLKKEMWIEKDVDAEQLPGVKAKFKRLTNKEHAALYDSVNTGEFLRADEEGELLKLIKSSIKDIEGVEFGEGNPATFEDIWENAPISLISLFVVALLSAQYDKDFLAK